MLAYFKAIINLPELFLELRDSFDMTTDAQEALDACVAMSED